MNALKREYLHVPVYAWLAGGTALLLAVLYFVRHRSATTAGATNSATSGSPGATGYPQNVYYDTLPGSGNVSQAPATAVSQQSYNDAFQLWATANWKNLTPGGRSFDQWISDVLGQYIKSTGQKPAGTTGTPSGTYTTTDMNELQWLYNAYNGTSQMASGAVSTGVTNPSVLAGSGGAYQGLPAATPVQPVRMLM